MAKFEVIGQGKKAAEKESAFILAFDEQKARSRAEADGLIFILEISRAGYAFR